MDWIEQLTADRQALDDIMLRLGNALNGPAQAAQRITETRQAHAAVGEAVEAVDRLLARL